MNANYIVWVVMAAIVVYAICMAIAIITDAFEDIEE